MVEIEVKLSGDLIEGLDKFEGKIKGAILRPGAAAMAELMYFELKHNTSGAGVQKREKDFVGPTLPGPPGVVTGTLHNSVYWAHSPERSTDDQQVYHVSVNKSKAPHWWMIEYGTSKSRPHPYLRRSLSRMKDASNAGLARIKELLGGES